MQAVAHGTMESFRERAEPFLLRAEAENNLILGICGGGPSNRDSWRDLTLVTVEDGGAVVGAAIGNPGLSRS